MGNLLTKVWGLLMACMCSSCFTDDDTAERQPLLDPNPDVHDQAERGDASVESKRLLPVAPKPVPKRRALLIGICYGECGPQEDLNELKGPHKDVTAMRSLLIELYGYRQRDIVVMMDRVDVEPRLQPTKDNIKRELKALVKDAQPGDRFVFTFSGHSDQREQKLEDNLFPEEDGKDEIMLTIDGKEIRDNKLHKCLVQPLPVGASLFALFDTCHSGTMLDLPHHNCNAIYVPWLSKGKRRTGTLRMKQNRALALSGGFGNNGQMPSIAQLVERQDAHSMANTTTTSTNDSRKLTLNTRVQPVSMARTFTRRGATARSPLASVPFPNSIIGEVFVSSPMCDSPDATLPCYGFCPYDERWKTQVADVKSLSACTDMQQAWEDWKGRSLIPLFCEYLQHRAKHHKTVTHRDLMSHLSHRIYKNSVKLHEWTLAQRRRARSEGKEPPEGEFLNFQTPELSSLAKLVRLDLLMSLLTMNITFQDLSDAFTL
ncbi:hypothetical protein PENSPDRAFT_680222 [Peniophora sp. CONT]|nr:hypothetical protein PENSPDRAFT_680222 [Peniophora sp. CONT]